MNARVDMQIGTFVPYIRFSFGWMEFCLIRLKLMSREAYGTIVFEVAALGFSLEIGYDDLS